MPDSTEYGWVFTDSDTKDNLYNDNRDYYGNRTWEKLYNQAAIDAQSASDAAQLNYQSSLAEAYTAAMQNKSALYQTSLYGEAKEAQLANIDSAMEAAFATYQNNLYSQEQAINEKYQQNLAAIDEALTKQAENYNALASSAYEYLQFLYDEYDMSGDDENNIFVNNDLWSRYTTTDADDTARLKTWQELVNAGAKDENGEYIGFFDEHGNLTVKGSEFFDQMFNEISVKGVGGEDYKYGKGYWEWLNETNPELKAWAQSANPYDYTTAGTNIGSLKQDVGLLSTDETYRFMERFGGFTAEEAKAMYAGFESELNTLIDRANSEDGKNKGREITQSVLALSGKLQKYCDDLGIALTDDDWSLINGELTAYINRTTTAGEMTGDWFKNVGSNVTLYAGGAGIAGAAAGTVLGPGGSAALGGIMAVAGAIVGFLGGIVSASINTDNSRKANQQAAKDATARLNETLVYLTNYAAEQQGKTSLNYKAQMGVK